MDTSVQIVDIPMLRYIPEILAWLFGIILAVLMVRRGGSRAEKLLLAGCSLMFVTLLVGSLLSEFVHSMLSERDISNKGIAQAMAWVTIPMSIMMLAGFVCLVIAFWFRFRAKRQVSA